MFLNNYPSQLTHYTNQYRAEGRGIYLVLWFGYLEASNNKNPCAIGTKEKKVLPKTIDEMKSLLKKQYADLPEQTKIFVLDVSKP